MKRFPAWLLLAAAAAFLPPALPGDTLVIAGAGVAGQWDTEVDIANVSAEPVEVVLSIVGLPLGAPCPPNCTGKTYDLPARGTVTVRASDFIGAAYPGPQMVRVEASGGGPLPVVHARSVSSESSCQFAELPVFRSSSIEALVAPVLVFPGVVRGGGTYSNLILEALGGAGATVEVELLDAAGHSLGSGVFLVPGESTFNAFTLVDVAARFGVATLDLGQVRVHKVSGTGVLWGALTTVGADGSVRVTVGANP